MEQVLQPAVRGFLPGPAAMTDAMNDLLGHAIGTMAGTRAALEGVLKRFGPQELEAKLASKSVLDSVLPMNRKAKLWELYLQHYESIRDEAQEDFHTHFSRAFLAAYEQQLERLRREKSAAPEHRSPIAARARVGQRKAMRQGSRLPRRLALGGRPRGERRRTAAALRRHGARSPRSGRACDEDPVQPPPPPPNRRRARRRQAAQDSRTASPAPLPSSSGRLDRQSALWKSATRALPGPARRRTALIRRQRRPAHGRRRTITAAPSRIRRRTLIAARHRRGVEPHTTCAPRPARGDAFSCAATAGGALR
jgi:hypothetical protein